MIQKIEFKTSKNAQSVAEHLYNVQVVNNYLVFSDFDEQAFDLAVALEGLNESAYNILQDRRTARTFNEYGSVIRQSTRFFDPPKYVVKIKLLESVPCLALLTNSVPRFLGCPNNSKELSIDLMIDEVFAEFMSILLTEVLDANSIVLRGKLSGKIDKAVFFAKNVCTKDVQHFLEICCDGRPQTVRLFSVNNVTLERISF